MWPRNLAVVLVFAAELFCQFNNAALATDAEVVFFGTSITKHMNWENVLQDANGFCTDRNVRGITVARAGVGSTWGVLESDHVAQRKPTAVIIEFAINDADIFDGISLDHSKRNIRSIVSSLRVSTPEPSIAILITNPVFGLHRLVRHRLERYYSEHRKLAEKLGIDVIDTYFHWPNTKFSLVWSNLVPDGLHPTKEAQLKYVVPSVLMYLDEMLEC